MIEVGEVLTHIFLTILLLSALLFFITGIIYFLDQTFQIWGWEDDEDVE